METLQLAQMLADLSNLNAADPHSTNSLFSPNKAAIKRPLDSISSTPASAPTTPLPSISTPAQQSISYRAPLATTPGHVMVSGPSSPLLTAGTFGTFTSFDSYIGRHLLSPPVSGTSSLPGTPRGETDSDVDRASALLALYELRAKLKQYNDSNSLELARKKILALSAQQQKQQQTSQSHNTATSPISVPQHHSLDRQHTQYTYPHVNSK